MGRNPKENRYIVANPLNKGLSMVSSKEKHGGMPMYMRLIKGRWYSNIRDPKNWRKKIAVSLDAYEHETRKATLNLGRIVADLEKGINPTSARQNMGRLKLSGRITERTSQILDKHIYPYFGGYNPREILRALLEK